MDVSIRGYKASLLGEAELDDPLDGKGQAGVYGVGGEVSVGDAEPAGESS
jgi:hypothetical protein